MCNTCGSGRAREEVYADATQCIRTHRVTSTVAAISQATVANASDASRRMRSTSTYKVARYTKYGMIDHMPNRMVVFRSAMLRPLPTM
ncbi:hypothetical protein D3C76_1564100 [compost metagenome]